MVTMTPAQAAVALELVVPEAAVQEAAAVVALEVLAVVLARAAAAPVPEVVAPDRAVLVRVVAAPVPEVVVPDRAVLVRAVAAPVPEVVVPDRAAPVRAVAAPAREAVVLAPAVVAQVPAAEARAAVAPVAPARAADRVVRVRRPEVPRAVELQVQEPAQARPVRAQQAQAQPPVRRALPAPVPRDPERAATQRWATVAWVTRRAISMSCAPVAAGRPAATRREPAKACWLDRRDRRRAPRRPETPAASIRCAESISVPSNSAAPRIA